MEKNIRSAVAVAGMSTLADSSVQQALVNAILTFRSQVQPSVSAETREKIANLRGVLDTKTLTSARNGGDWRRGAASGTAVNNSSSTANSPFASQQQQQGDLGNRWRPSSQNGMRMRPNVSSGSLNSFGSQSPLSQGKSPVYTGPPVGRYQSRFKNQTEAIEDKILNRIILLKLNKFGPTTYTDIRDFLFQILGQESVMIDDGGSMKAEAGQVTEFVRDFMLMVFKKAAAEEIYCPLYAKLLAEIGSKHSVIFDEMARLYGSYMEIFEEPDVNSEAIGTEAFEKKNLEKKYRLGYSQFIAELTALEILSLDALASTTKVLLKLVDQYSRLEDNRPLVDEYVDCLLRMSRVLKAKNSAFFVGARTRLYSDNREMIDTLINLRDGTYQSLSAKSRFLIMDILEIYHS
jgi:hypothetical protein